MTFLLDIGRASMWAVNAMLTTATNGKVGHAEPPPKVVLVPPLFERDLRLRSRSEYLPLTTLQLSIVLHCMRGMSWSIGESVGPSS